MHVLHAVPEKVPDRSEFVVKKNRKKYGIDRLRCISCAACVDVCPKKMPEYAHLVFAIRYLKND